MAKYNDRKMLFFSKFWNKQKISKNEKFMVYYDIIRKMYELYHSLEYPDFQFKYLVNSTIFDNIKIIDLILAEYSSDFQSMQNHPAGLSFQDSKMLEKHYADKFYHNMEIFVNQIESDIDRIW